MERALRRGDPKLHDQLLPKTGLQDLFPLHDKSILEKQIHVMYSITCPFVNSGGWCGGLQALGVSAWKQSWTVQGVPERPRQHPASPNKTPGKLAWLGLCLSGTRRDVLMEKSVSIAKSLCPDRHPSQHPVRERQMGEAGFCIDLSGEVFEGLILLLTCSVHTVCGRFLRVNYSLPNLRIPANVMSAICCGFSASRQLLNFLISTVSPRAGNDLQVPY